MAEDRVKKRDGKLENISFDKIGTRLKKLGMGQLDVNYTSLVQKVIDRLYDKIPTSEIDELTAQQCASLSTTHPDYGVLASRIMISNHQKNTPSSLKECMSLLYNFRDVNDKHCPIVNSDLWLIMCNYHEEIEQMIDYNRDYLFDYFGFKTLERAYLMRVNSKIVERPQHMIMRVALALHGSDLDSVKESYELMSQKFFTHATPTLFNAGTNRQQMSSCYLIGMESDSIGGIYNTLSDCASISKWAGGIGMHIHNIRAAGSHIRGTNGTSNGIVPMLRVFNNTARYCDQCVTPETYIYTTEGPKQIQYCTNDTIIFNNSDKKNYEKIKNVLEHPYEGDILNINTMHSIESLNITDEHPIFVLKKQKTTNYSVIKNRLKKKIIKPVWDEAKNLTDKDFLIFNIPKYEKDISYIDEDDCYIYGVILGDGCVSNTDTTCYISLHKDEKKYILDKIITYFEKKCIRYNINIENNTCRIRWGKNTILPFRYSEIYDINKEKIIHSRWLNLPLHKSKYILKGLIDTDGCKHNELTFDNTSRNVIESMKYLFLRMGVLTSGYIRDRRGETHVSKYGCKITNKKISYCLRIPKTDEVSELIDIEKGTFFKFFRHKDLLFSRIKNITKDSYSGTLYDLQMEKHHNYMIHNGIVHNGGGKRKGSFAIYLEPWHGDIESFLDMKKNHGDEEQRARDLFYALWIPDLFMKRVKSNSEWTLMCPDKCPGLSDVYGDEFETLYEKYESEGKGNKTVKARDIWLKILDSQIETGTPYMLYKDAANKKSNQKNLGTIKSSNLCCEIMEYSDDKDTAVCNLASIGLSNFINPLQHSYKSAKVWTKNDCGYCKMAKRLLDDNNINYQELDVENHKEEFEKYKKQKFDSEETEIKTVPQIELDGNYIGDYSTLEDLLRPEFDYEKLHEVTKIVTNNLNKVIDINFYPTEKTQRSNFKHRPVGIGIQGLADAFALMNLPFHSDKAKEINVKIFETIYHAALEKSCEISKSRIESMNTIRNSYNKKEWSFENSDDYCTSYKINYQDDMTNGYSKIQRLLEIYKPIPDEIKRDTHLGSYSSFIGSPANLGILQFDMWDVTPSDRYDWSTLKENIKKYGIRNSLLLAPMPTASTSQILGNNECFEPFTSNIYVRRTLAGEFVIINKYLLNELITLDLWNSETKNSIIKNRGSIQHMKNIPKVLRDRFKIVWEIPMKHVIEMSADRGAYICQSQSLNLWMENPSYNKLTKMHFFGWSKGLKTGEYYLRTKAKAAPQQFTIEPDKKNQVDEEDCLMCGA